MPTRAPWPLAGIARPATSVLHRLEGDRGSGLMRRLGLALTAGLAACASPTAPVQPTRHLLEDVADEATPLSLEGETRPALRLGSGERRPFRVDAPAGARLVFALGIADVDYGCDAVALQVQADGRPLLEERIPAQPRRWRLRALEMPPGGARELAFLASDPCGGGGIAPGAAHPFALGSPRLHDRRPAPRRRVVVWISQDTLRADHLPAWGYGRPTAPHTARRAEEWTVFEQAVAAASWTLPSLASQFTSRYPSFHGAVMARLATDAPSVFEALSEAGFTVLGSTGNEFISPEHGLSRGFDSLLYTKRRGRGQARELLGRLREWEGGDLVLLLHLLDPHLPYRAPPPYQDMFDEQGYSGPIAGTNHFYERDAEIGPVDRQHLVDLYDGEIAYNDEVIERFLDGLSERGLLDDALLVYSSDHGEQFRDHGGWIHGATLYEEVVHVPLALRVPGLAPGRVTTPVSLIDLAPTLLDALGVAAPRAFQGQSLLPLVRGERRDEQPLFSETAYTPERNQVLAVRSGSLKYILTVPRGTELRPPILTEELYDLSSDPAEQQNLLPGAGEATALRRAAFAFLARARSEGGPGRAVDLSPETEEQLRAWGYIQ